MTATLFSAALIGPSPRRACRPRSGPERGRRTRIRPLWVKRQTRSAEAAGATVTAFASRCFIPGIATIIAACSLLASAVPMKNSWLTTPALRIANRICSPGRDLDAVGREAHPVVLLRHDDLDRTRGLFRIAGLSDRRSAVSGEPRRSHSDEGRGRGRESARPDRAPRRFGGTCRSGSSAIAYSAAARTGSPCGWAEYCVDAALDLRAEMRDQALDRPGRGVAERADRVALDLLGNVEQHVDLALVRAALGHAADHAPHPARALAARRALAAALVLVEIAEPGDGADDVGRLVHHDDRRRAEARSAACRANRNPSGSR